jgi:hypothetical protein
LKILRRLGTPRREKPQTSLGTFWAYHAYRSVFGDLFFALPNEIQVLVLCKLHWRDLLTLRATTRGFHELLHENESTIVRRHISCPDFDLPPYCLSLFPPPKPPVPLSFDYVFGITHRHAVAIQLAQVVATIARDKIYGAPNAPERYRALEPKCKNMVKKLIPGLFTLFHFFESYRSIFLQRIADEGKRKAPCPTTDLMAGVEESLMETYDGPVLLEAHQIYQVLYSTFTRSLRPPSYAGTLERSLRGWHKAAASQRDMMKLLAFGGVREVKNVIRHQSYNARLAALEKFILSLGFGKKNKPQPRCTTISGLECSVMGPLDHKITGSAAPRLPKITDIWLDIAPQVMTCREVIRSLDEVPDLYEFMAEMMESDTDDERSTTDLDALSVSGTDEDAEADDEDDSEEIANGSLPFHPPSPVGFTPFSSLPTMNALASHA